MALTAHLGNYYSFEFCLLLASHASKSSRDHSKFMTEYGTSEIRKTTYVLVNYKPDHPPLKT